MFIHQNTAVLRCKIALGSSFSVLTLLFMYERVQTGIFLAEDFQSHSLPLISTR